MGNTPRSTSCRARSRLPYDDYFPHNQNKNDLAETRSFLVRVGRVESNTQIVKMSLGLANDCDWRLKSYSSKFRQVYANFITFRHLVGNPWATAGEVADGETPALAGDPPLAHSGWRTR